MRPVFATPVCLGAPAARQRRMAAAGEWRSAGILKALQRLGFVECRNGEGVLGFRVWGLGFRV